MVVEDLVRVVPFGDSGDKFVASIEFVPTIPHCNLATLIGKHYTWVIRVRRID